MTANDLRELLRTTAAEGSDAVDLAEDALADRIRRRRIRTRRFAVGGVALTATAVIAATTWAVRPGGGHPPAATTSPRAAAPVPFPHSCGARLAGQAPVEAPLRVTIARQQVAPAGGSGAYGRVTAVFANSSDTVLEGATASAVRVIVVNDGAVVATMGPITDNALHTTLPAKGSTTLAVPVPLGRCDGSALQPGSYQLYTEYSVAMSSTDATPGAVWKTLRSGPWTVDLPPRIVTSDADSLSGMQAALRATLTVDANGCVRAAGTAVTLVWPRGYTVRGDATSFEILDATNNVVARSGVPLDMGGGGVDRFKETWTGRDCLSGRLWMVGSIRTSR